MCGTALSNETRKARKRHTCDDCYTPIFPGEMYERQASVDGGSIGVFKSHVECAAAARSVMDFKYDDCLSNSLAEWSDDSGSPLATLGLPPIVLARLTKRRERHEMLSQAHATEFYTSNYPSGRWADDGGPA